MIIWQTYWIELNVKFKNTSKQIEWYSPHSHSTETAKSIWCEHINKIGRWSHHSHDTHRHKQRSQQSIHDKKKLTSSTKRYTNIWEVRKKQTTMRQWYIAMSNAVASLGWVTHGAVTEGVTPTFFSWKTWRPFFAHRCYYHYRFLLLSLGCHPSRGCHPQSPHLFFTCPTSFLHYSL